MLILPFKLFVFLCQAIPLTQVLTLSTVPTPCFVVLHRRLPLIPHPATGGVRSLADGLRHSSDRFSLPSSAMSAMSGQDGHVQNADHERDRFGDGIDLCRKRSGLQAFSITPDFETGFHVVHVPIGL